jgi:hypothetical protein
MQRDRRAAVGELVANAGIQKALHRKGFREQDFVLREFDMEVANPVRLQLHDGCPVDQTTRRDQNIIDEHSVIRRKHQVS